MYNKALLATAFAVLAAAAPAPVERSTYHGLTLELNVQPLTEPADYKLLKLALNTLTSLDKASVSEIKFGNPDNVDINKVECRAYKDVEGTVPGSNPFTKAQPAKLSTNVVEVDSVLCYIIE